MKRRIIWSGWQVQHMDEVVRQASVKLKKTTRSVSLPNLTAESCASLLPSLQQVEWLQLAEQVEPAAIPLLASLPKLTGIDLAMFRRSATDTALDAAVLDAVCALPALTSLFAVLMPGTLIPRLARAERLRWLALWHPQVVEAAHLAALGELSQLEELQILGQGVRPDSPPPVIGAAAFERLAARGCLRDFHLLDLNVDQGAVDALLQAKGLRRATLYFPAPPGKKLDVRVFDQPELALLELTMPGRKGELARLPALRELDVYGFEELVLDDLPQLTSFAAYSLAGGMTVRNLASLRKVRVELGPDRIEVIGAPRLARMEMKNCGLDAAAKQVLREALPRAELVLERPTAKKRKRTAPKRSLGAKDWKHPQVGVDWMSYAVLVAGRAYQEDLAVGKGKELATIAEAWSQQLGEHVIAVMPFDLSKKTGSLSSSDEISPVVIGWVVSLVSADDGPSKPVELKERAALPAEFWAEVAGVIGNDAVERARDGLYLVAAGPLAEALLAHGELVRTEETTAESLIRGQRFDQTPHELGVKGVLVDATEDCAQIELDDLPAGPGTLHLICRYD